MGKAKYQLLVLLLHVGMLSGCSDGTMVPSTEYLFDNPDNTETNLDLSYEESLEHNVVYTEFESHDQEETVETTKVFENNHTKDEVQKNMELFSVLENKKTFISESGEAVYLKNYCIGKNDFAESIFANPKEYVYVDFNADGKNELVVNISEDYGFLLVLYSNGYDIFGYEFGIRSMQALKTDGSFIGSDGAASLYYCGLSFDDEKCNVTHLAVKDSTMNIFELNGKECSVQELNEYINDWELKESVDWIECDEQLKNMYGIDNKTEEQGSSIAPDIDRINLNQYVSVNYDGFNLAGYATVVFNKEQFLLDHIDDISYNKENRQVYHELYGNTGKSAANAIMKYISVNLIQSGGLSNGDIIETVWNIDFEKIETYFETELVFSSQTYTVSGLSEAEAFDPFENVRLRFYGNVPYGKASIEVYGTTYGGEYEIYPNEQLKNGDQVIVKYKCASNPTMISLYGTYPEYIEKAYIVKGLNSYVQSIDDMAVEDYNMLVSTAASHVWVSGYGYYEEAKYCGNYFYSAKDQPAHGVYFLNWCGTPVGNAVCFVFEHPKMIGDSSTIYSVIVLENLLLNEQGELINGKNEMWKMMNQYENQEDLENAFINVYDEIMCCDNNVTFQ